MGEFISLGTAIKTDPTRVAVILDVVLDFFNGTDSKLLSERVKIELGQISGAEFAYAAQILAQKDNGTDPFEAKFRRELLMHEVFDDALAEAIDSAEPDGHPLTSLRAENDQLRALVIQIRSQLADPNSETLRHSISENVDRLAAVNTHYTRKENQLFPYLEVKGFDRPSTVMWAQHDAIRGFVKEAKRSSHEDSWNSFTTAVNRLVDSVLDMVHKEEKVLFPTSLELLSDYEWGEIRSGDDEIGYCLIDQPVPWAPLLSPDPGPNDPASDAKSLPKAKAFTVTTRTGQSVSANGQPPIGAVQLTGGHLKTQQLNGILRSLNADITYVDENDRVRFYNKGEDRVFPRSKGIIGREVRYCHPPKSVHVVLDIVNAFRAGERDTADFWIQMGPAFVYIRYFAIRDSTGTYRGVLEVSQEVSELRRPISETKAAEATSSQTGMRT